MKESIARSSRVYYSRKPTVAKWGRKHMYRQRRGWRVSPQFYPGNESVRMRRMCSDRCKAIVGTRRCKARTCTDYRYWLVFKPYLLVFETI